MRKTLLGMAVGIGGMLIMGIGGAAEEALDFSSYPANLRLRATFSTGEPVVDLGPGEQRMSRLWRGDLYNRFPWDGSGDRISLSDCLAEGPAEGRGAFDPRTDAAMRGLGALNARSGTVAFRLRRGAVVEQGGILLSGKSFVPGGPWGGVHWALGIGGARDSRAPAGRLFLDSSAVQCVSLEPLAGGEWIHLAAVWDADMGAILYADGREVGRSWRSPGAAEDALPPPEPEVFFPAEGLRAALDTTRISSGVGDRSWHPLLEPLPWEDATATWEAGEYLRIETRRTERLQLRMPSTHRLAPGPRMAVLRFRQQPIDDDGPGSVRGMGVRLTLREEQNGRPIGDIQHITLNTRGGGTPVGEWQEVSRVFLLGTTGKDGSYTAHFDINIYGPGAFELAGVRLIKATPEAIAAAANPALLSSYGGRWSDFVHGVVPVPVDRIHIHRHSQGSAIADVHVFDAPLATPEIRRLARGEIFDPGRALAFEPVRADRERRSQVLGWGAEEDGDLVALSPARPVTVREQWAERAYEDLRTAGSIAVDGIPFTLSPWPYHGYQHVVPRKLHVKFAAPAGADYLVARGNLSGRLLAGGTRAAPFAGEEVLALPGSPAIFRKRLDRPLAAPSATVLREAGQLAGLHFYRIDEGFGGLPPARAYYLHGDVAAGPPPLGEWKRQEFVTAYGPADRRYIVGREDPATRTEVRRIAAFRSHHFFTPALAEDVPLAGIGLRLNLRGMDTATRLQVRVHDGFDPWRELVRMDFRLEPAGTGEGVYELALLLRETLALQGEPVWVSTIFDRPVSLVSRPGPEGSMLRLFEADPDVATGNFLEWELSGWRTAFESTSEPRVWSRGISDEDDDGWWLRASSPEYEHMVRVGRELRRRFPGEPRVEAWFAFIHPNMPNPATGVELPDPGPHPRWAVLARANLARYAEFVDWWTDNRAHENGELGNWVGDDTDLLQDWPDLALIDGPGHDYRDVILRLADGVVDGTYLTRGQPFIVNGLNSRWTDGLHAYEDGMNMMPMAFQLEYGNPVLFHRLLETASRYDGFLLTEERDGKRLFNSDGAGTAYWNTDRPPAGSPFDRNWYLATHAGQVLMWYNGSPKVSGMFAELAAGLFEARHAGKPVNLARGGSYLMLALWQRFGDERYLAELVDLERARAEGILTRPGDPTLVKRLPEGLYDPALTLEASRADAADRFEQIGTRSLGFGDRRYERNWFEWFLSRDKTHLEEGLAALYRRLTFSMPAVTVAEQSGDRVSVPKQLVSHLYLGGVPAARNNQFYPMYAASYEGLGRNFAALVLDDTEDLLRVLFYSFEDGPLRGRLTAWGVGPGRFDITGGPDRAGDDRIDAIEHRSRLELVRGDAFAIEIPPQQLYIWEALRVEAGRPLWERPDLALAAEEAEREADGALLVRVHNIGSAPAPGAVVELQDAAGRAVARRELPPLEAPLDLRPRTAELRFTAEETTRAETTDGALVVVVDPDETLEEITRRNNRVRIAPRVPRRMDGLRLPGASRLGESREE